MKKIKYIILFALASAPSLSSAQSTEELEGVFISDFSTILCGREAPGKEANARMVEFLTHSSYVTPEKVLGLNSIEYRKAWLLKNGDVLTATISRIEFPGVYVEQAKDSLHKIIFFQFGSYLESPVTFLLSSSESSTLCLVLDYTESTCEAIMRGTFRVVQLKNDGTKQMARSLVAMSDMMNTILNITLCDSYVPTPVIIKQ